MIPKIIHYCWFGGNQLNGKSKKCIESWKKFFPDYEIKEWNESNFDVNQCKYAQEAYKEKNGLSSAIMRDSKFYTSTAEFISTLMWRL